MRRSFTRTWLVFLGVLFPMAELLAADAGESGDVVDINLPVWLWTLLVFLVVLFILKQKAWGPLLQALDERERKIRESLEAAEKAQAESQRVAKEHEKVLAEARKEASAVVEEGKRDAEAVRDGIVSEARDSAEDVKNRALADIERAKDNAVHEIHQNAVGLSIAISEKLIGKALTADEHRGLIDETIQRYERLN